MNCQEARERLPALIDGEIDPPELAEVEKHLAECPACREERQRQEKFTTSVKVSLEGLKPSDLFVKGVLDKLPASPPAASAPARPPSADAGEAAAKRRTGLSLLAAVAVIVLALLALWLVARHKAGAAAPEKPAPAPKEGART